MLKLHQTSWHKLSLLSVSIVTVSTVIACAPLKAYDNTTARYEGNTNSSQSSSGFSQSEHKRHLFHGHELDNYNLSAAREDTPLQPIQKFAAAEDIRLSPYVPPSRNTQRLVPSNLPVRAADTPTLRPRFQHHLDNATAVSPNIITPKAAPIRTQIAKPRSNIQQSVSVPLNRNTATITPEASFFTKNTPKAAPLSIGRFETAQPAPAALPIPLLPEPQRQVIRQEQSALIGIENKDVLAGPGSLRQSLDSAFARSSRLAAENLRVDEAQEVLKQANAQYKPRLDFRSTVGPRTSETTFAFSNTTASATTIRRSAELDLSLPIYQGGRLRAQRSSAKLGIETARATVAQTRGQIIEQTAIAYLDVVRDRKLVNLYEDNVNLLREQQSSVAELLALNESTISEKALIDARLATQRIRLETGLGILRESEAHYKNLVGAPAPPNLPVPVFNLPLSLIEVQALAQQNSPELTALITRAKSAEFDVDIAKSGTKPSLALQGVVRGAEGQSETINRNAAAELLLNFHLPLSTGGEGRSRVRQAKLIRNRLNLEIRDTQDQLRDQIDRLWARKLASEKSQNFNQTQIVATEFAVRTVAEQRAEGVATILDLLNVQQTLLDAQIQTVEARSLQDTASVQLLNLMGIYQ